MATEALYISFRCSTFLPFIFYSSILHLQPLNLSPLPPLNLSNFRLRPLHLWYFYRFFLLLFVIFIFDSSRFYRSVYHSFSYGQCFCGTYFAIVSDLRELITMCLSFIISNWDLRTSYMYMHPLYFPLTNLYNLFVTICPSAPHPKGTITTKFGKFNMDYVNSQTEH